MYFNFGVIRRDAEPGQSKRNGQQLEQVDFGGLRSREGEESSSGVESSGSSADNSDSQWFPSQRHFRLGGALLRRAEGQSSRRAHRSVRSVRREVKMHFRFHLLLPSLSLLASNDDGDFTTRSSRGIPPLRQRLADSIPRGRAIRPPSRESRLHPSLRAGRLEAQSGRQEVHHPKSKLNHCFHRSAKIRLNSQEWRSGRDEHRRVSYRFSEIHRQAGFQARKGWIRSSWSRNLR